MDAENLGRMFAPSIIRHPTNTMDLVATQVEAVIVSYFILNVMGFSKRKGKEGEGKEEEGEGEKEKEKEREGEKEKEKEEER